MIGFWETTDYYEFEQIRLLPIFKTLNEACYRYMCGDGDPVYFSFCKKYIIFKIARSDDPLKIPKHFQEKYGMFSIDTIDYSYTGTWQSLENALISFSGNLDILLEKGELIVEKHRITTNVYSTIDECVTANIKMDEEIKNL